MNQYNGIYITINSDLFCKKKYLNALTKVIQSKKKESILLSKN